VLTAQKNTENINQVAQKSENIKKLILVRSRAKNYFSNPQIIR